MGGFEIDLNKLKNIKLTKGQQQKLLLGVVFVFGGIYLYWNKVMIPLGRQAADLKGKLEEKQKMLEDARRYKNDWESYLQRQDAAQRAERFVARRIPADKGGIGTLININKIFVENRVAMGKYVEESDTLKPPDATGFSKVTAQVAVNADYFSFGKLLSGLSEEEVVYNVEDVQIESGKQQLMPGSISVNMKLVTYVDRGGAK